MTASNATPQLKAETRKGAGKGAARAIRREGKLPAVLYGAGGQPQSLALVANDVRLQYLKGRFRSRLLELSLDGKAVKVLPRDVQFNPVSDVIEHVDFLRVDEKTTIRVGVPVKFRDQDKSPGIKRGGVLNVVRHEIEFECRPSAIPAFIEVSVSGLEIGASVHINSLKLPEGIAPVIKRNFTVATIAGRSAQMEEEVTTAPAAGAVPTEGDLAAAAAGEGAAAPAAGAAAAPAKPEAGKKEEKK